MYATSSGEGICVWSGDNLENLSYSGLCYYKKDSFGDSCFWAPEVIRRYDGKFVMHFSAKDRELNSLRVGVAIADTPLGPFVDFVKGKPMFDLGYPAIDASCFVDEDGSGYLYFSKDCSENIVDGVHVSQVYGARLNKELTELVSEPILLLKPIKEWESYMIPAPLTTLIDDGIHKAEKEYYLWNEAPFVIKQNGVYYMTYSANCFDSRYYGVGLARSNSPLGPFVKDELPLLQVNDGKTCGTGHSMFFKKDEKLYMAFHCHTDYSRPSGDRRFCFLEAKLIDGKIQLL